MDIVKVEAIPLFADFATEFKGIENVPDEIRHPARTYTGQGLTGQGCVVIRVTTEDGRIGLGETMGRPGSLGMAALTEEILAPIMVGRNALEIATNWELMADVARFTPAIVSGVDIALWDLAGQHYGTSIAELLGGPVRESVDCYASPVPLFEDPGETASRAQAYVEQGFTAVKIKVGRGKATDLAHVAAARSAIGDSTRLLVDANDGYSRAEACEVGRGLSEIGIYWFEEPVHHDRVEDLRDIRIATGLRVASGEWMGDVNQLRNLIASRAVDVVMPNIVRCGGITGLRRLSEFAAHYGVEVSPHGVGGGIALSASVQAGLSLPALTLYEYNQLFNPLREGLLTDPPKFAGGHLFSNPKPGLGTQVHQDKLDQYRTG